VQFWRVSIAELAPTGLADSQKGVHVAADLEQRQMVAISNGVSNGDGVGLRFKGGGFL
jgi:hypothetical protein